MNSPNHRTTHTTLRRKLLKIVLGILCLVSLSILGLVSWLNMRTEQVRLADLEGRVKASIESKARVVVDNQAYALRGLVADNVFSDVRTLVEGTVADDPDVIYGIFVSAEGTPWAYASPSTSAKTEDQKKNLDLWTELGIAESELNVKDPTEHTRQIFAQGILEVARPVSVDGEVLGTVRYGFTTRPLELALSQARQESQETLHTLLKTIALCVFCCTLIGFVWVSSAATHMVRPLRVLKQATDRIAAGERGVRVQVDSDDEIEALALAFNDMQQANEDAMERLNQAMEAALEASRLKSEFLANMSHEIRTPMNGVIGMIRLILKMPLDSKLRRYAETVDVSASALMTIINDILDFSKMEAGKYEIQTAPFEPGIVVQEVAELLSGRAHDKGIELVYRCDQAVPQIVSGDPDRYRQVLNNLVGNAIKFTEEGEIFIEQTLVDEDENSFVIHTQIQDTGTGISKDDMDKLFSAFSQVDGSMVRRHGGTGLGLVISKRLSEMMGGDIGVSSELGLGSRFWFTVKVARSEARKRKEPSPVAGQRRALVVEGSRRWCRIIEEHLIAWGISCDVFQSGRQALEKLKERDAKTYDVAVIGAQLRDFGIEKFVKEFRQHELGKNVPLVVLTQLGATATLSEVENEVAAQISKPLRLSELYDCLLGAFSGQTMHSQPRAKVVRLKHRGQRILIVDDNEINQFVATEQVESAGFDADVANNGQEAVDMVKSNRYAVVLMDCQMPIMDGYTAARTIREWEEEVGGHVPIIALTAHAMTGERDKVLAAGMDDYLSKPLRAHGLEKMLERYVGEDLFEETRLQAHQEHSRSEQLPELDMEIKRSSKLSELFIDRVPGTLQDLKQAIQSDPKSIRDHAHKLKGSCLAVGAELMAKEAESLQFECEKQQVERAPERLVRLEQQFSRVRALLQRELDSNSGVAASQPASAGRSLRTSVYP